MYDVGLTAMALLCFLEAGYQHESQQELVDDTTGKRYKIGEAIKRGGQWLIRRQQPEGFFSDREPYMYNEALAAMALIEAYRVSTNAYWKSPAQKSADFLQKA